MVVYDGVIREARSRGQASGFAGYGVAPAVTVGAIAVTDLRTGRRVVRADSSSIAFDPVPEEVIDFRREGSARRGRAHGGTPKDGAAHEGNQGEHGFAHGALEDRRGGLLMDAIAEREKAGGK